MSDATTINTTNTTAMTPSATFAVAATAVFGALSTTDKKGNRVSFERSIMVASKADRTDLSIKVYERQCSNGIYGPLVNDAMAAGLLGKGAAAVVDAMTASAGRNMNKETAAAICRVIISQTAGKTFKGAKGVYQALIVDLHKALTA